MSIQARNKIRKNVKSYADMDYLSKLSPEDKEYMVRFVDEAYCNSHGKEGSLHRTALGDSYDTAKKELYLAHNAQNRDAYSIAGCSNNLVEIDEMQDTLTVSTRDTLEDELVTRSPDAILNTLTEEYSDEINTSSEDVTAALLKEYGVKVIALYLLVKKESDRQTRLRRKEKSRDLEETDKSDKI
jgi:hypothetical protein